MIAVQTSEERFARRAGGAGERPNDQALMIDAHHDLTG